MTEMIVEGKGFALEEEDPTPPLPLPVPESQSVQVQEQQSVEMLDATGMIAMVDQLVFLQGTEPGLQLNYLVQFTDQFLSVIQNNMIALGYGFHVVQEDWIRRYQVVTSYSTFDDWISLGIHYDLTMVKNAIRLYLVWSKVRKVEVEPELLIQNPPSSKKNVIMAKELRKHERLMERIVKEHTGSSSELEEKKEQLVHATRAKIEDILTQPDSVLIREEHEQDGTRDRIKLYMNGYRWDEDTERLTLGTLSLAVREDCSIGEQLRLLYEDTLEHWIMRVRIDATGETISLLELAERLENEDGEQDKDDDDDEDEDDGEEDEFWDDEEYEDEEEDEDEEYEDEDELDEI